jgi:Leucine-rich repeat (LRR) protein
MYHALIFNSSCSVSLLQNNNINGLIPAEIGKLAKLKTLDLSSNHFSGEIPSSVGHLESLQYL